jgi:hypothetical protein
MKEVMKSEEKDGHYLPNTNDNKPNINLNICTDDYD